MSARRRLARSVRPDRSPASVPATLFDYPVQIVDKQAEPTTKTLMAAWFASARKRLIRSNLDILDLLILAGVPDSSVKSSPPFKIYRPEAN